MNRKCTWPEAHMTGTACDRKCANGTRTEVQKKKTQTQTSPRNFQKPIKLTNHKNQPIRHLEQRGVNKTQKECSALNMAALHKKSVFSTRLFLSWRFGELRQLTLCCEGSLNFNSLENLECPGESLPGRTIKSGLAGWSSVKPVKGSVRVNVVIIAKLLLIICC